MEQKIRAVLFYLSVISFFILVPIVLLYSFGYKLDINRLRIIKTGLIYINSTPEGAKVYLNGRRINKTTPASIRELMPGAYKLSLEREKYYSWYRVVLVESGKSTTLDNIVLFPIKPHLDKINISDIDGFYIFPADKDYAYCISKDRTAIFKINLDPKEKEASLFSDQLQLPDNIKNISLAPDKKKIFCFYANRLDVIYLADGKANHAQVRRRNFFIITDRRISDAFWYSDSEHVVIITDKDIKIYELISEGRDNLITAFNINNKSPRALYDITEDILYFTQEQEGPDGESHKGLYCLDISKKSLFTIIKGIEKTVK